MLIFLVGFMGCGKSTIGRRVAKRLGYDFVDMDASIEQREGRNVSDIFRDEGEEAFRTMERRFVDELPGDGNTVVATGGGAPCFNDTMSLMKRKGKVIYFRMRPELLAMRIGPGRQRRPKTAGMDDARLLEYVRGTLAAREECYSQASVVLDCNGVGDEYIATHILHYVSEMEKGKLKMEN